jgi:type I restriction enzyme, S subunit
VNKLPSGWAATTLGDVVEPATATIAAAESTLPYLGLDGVESISTRVLAYRDSQEIRGQAKRFDVGYTLYARLRPYLNKVAAPNMAGVASTEFMIFPPTKTLAPRFLLYLLNNPIFVDFANRNAEGIERPRLSWQRMSEYRFALPPLAEQRRIVAAVEEEFSCLDAALEYLKRAQRGVIRFRAAALAETASNWPEQPLGDFSRIFVGATPSRRRPEFWEGGLPWVSSGEVAFCRITYTRETIAAAAVTAERVHPPGTVLLAMIGEGRTRGQAAILDVAAAHNQNSAAIRLDPGVCTPEWLFYVLMARYEQTRAAGSGGQQPALNSSRVAALKIPLPPLEDQSELVARIEQRTSTVAALELSFLAIRSRAAALRSSMLGHAFRGALVPQDPNDEPASLALARIAATRSAPSRAARTQSERATA